ncbi:RWD domain-containing protein 1 [Biomphalaria glabrata]|uniref:RWD domain-containing protein 1-like n=2 Tax=Biomphalaria TaxID=6525 RepID=A0A9U8E5W0_BIOGL|nr:RWD domain-containing protein 1-like [Biomphalaria glabrata]KAI8758154.1 RWD domain-containing protein 1-like [Biomphalaria glabrata]KAK0052888.1 RWD domain-containing protein 1 [Biomphalaria pfeifferi]
MTDYKEEQRNEIEALQSIYPDEIEIIEEQPYYSFKLQVGSQDPDKFPDHAMSAVIQFTYTHDYPDSAPDMLIESTENMDDAQQESLMEFMTSQAEENLGMAMIFTIISSVQERLTDMMEQAAKDQEEAIERKKKADEEAERKRFEGTRVTVESFMAWKLKFDAEKAEMRRLKGFSDGSAKKPTGKEQFMADQSLYDSDVKFLQAEGDTLEVDESLFDNMGDLDLEDDDDDDDDDDPDYQPGDEDD